MTYHQKSKDETYYSQKSELRNCYTKFAIIQTWKTTTLWTPLHNLCWTDWQWQTMTYMQYNFILCVSCVMKQAIDAIKNAEKKNDLKYIAKLMNLEYGFLWSFKNKKNKKYRVKYVDIIYDYFGLKKDKRYYRNRKMRNKKTYSIIGTILRLWRIRKWLSLDDVCKKIQWDKRQLQRIEHGDSLPNANSYYISEMLKLCEFTEDEEVKILFGISLLQDLNKIFKKYDDITK